LKLVNDIAFAVVKQRKKEFKESRQQNGGVGEAGRSDIISLYLQRHDEESELTFSPSSPLRFLAPSLSAEDGELSDDVLRDVVINFMIAGRDTTANVT
jgi:cytochrome P450